MLLMSDWEDQEEYKSWESQIKRKANSSETSFSVYQVNDREASQTEEHNWTMSRDTLEMLEESSFHECIEVLKSGDWNVSYCFVITSCDLLDNSSDIALKWNKGSSSCADDNETKGEETCPFDRNSRLIERNDVIKEQVPDEGKWVVNGNLFG